MWSCSISTDLTALILKTTIYQQLFAVSSEFMNDTYCAFFSTEVFLQERFPVSLIHQVSNRVIKEGSVRQNVLLFIGQSHGQVGFLSGKSRRAERKREPESHVKMILQHLLSNVLQKDVGRILKVCQHYDDWQGKISQWEKNTSKVHTNISNYSCSINNPPLRYLLVWSYVCITISPKYG